MVQSCILLHQYRPWCCAHGMVWSALNSLNPNHILAHKPETKYQRAALQLCLMLDWLKICHCQAGKLASRCRIFLTSWRIVATVLAIDTVNDILSGWQKSEVSVTNSKLQHESAAAWIGELLSLIGFWKCADNLQENVHICYSISSSSRQHKKAYWYAAQFKQGPTVMWLTAAGAMLAVTFNLLFLVVDGIDAYWLSALLDSLRLTNLLYEKFFHTRVFQVERSFTDLIGACAHEVGVGTRLRLYTPASHVIASGSSASDMEGPRVCLKVLPQTSRRSKPSDDRVRCQSVKIGRPRKSSHFETWILFLLLWIQQMDSLSSFQAQQATQHLSSIQRERWKSNCLCLSVWSLSIRIFVYLLFYWVSKYTSQSQAVMQRSAIHLTSETMSAAP